MGTDIHIHVEYQQRSKRGRLHWVHANEEFERDRNYDMFGILAGLRSDIVPKFPPRGLPEDVSLETEQRHKDWGEGAHTESWLTTQEFGACLEAAEEIYRERYPDEYEEGVLKGYKHIYQYMKDSDDEGEPARIIFWFDN